MTLATDLNETEIVGEEGGEVEGQRGLMIFAPRTREGKAASRDA